MSRTLDLGGTERQLTEIALTLDRRQFEPVVVAFDARGARADALRREDIEVVELPVRSLVSYAAALHACHFITWLRRRGVALVHAFDMPTTVFGVPLARLARVPVVLGSQRGDRRLVDRSAQRLLALTDRCADGIVVNSGYVRRVLREQFAVPDTRMYHAPNGIDPAVFRPSGSRADVPAGRDVLVVGTVAALRTEKSIETLIDAVAILRDEPCHLVIVGEGPCGEPLRKRVSDAGLDARCTFVPPPPDIASWYRAMDVFVLPSVNESFSNALMEAMACGCAVVASNVGGNPELVRDGENGLLFEASNATDLAVQIGRLLRDAPFRARLAANAVATIHDGYTRESAARHMEELYLELLNGAGEPVVLTPQACAESDAPGTPARRPG